MVKINEVLEVNKTNREALYIDNLEKNMFINSNTISMDSKRDPLE